MFATTPTPKHMLPNDRNPGRGRIGVQTEWGERNAAFIAARQHAKDGNLNLMQNAIAAMAKVQPLSKREQEAINRNLPERRQPAPRDR